MYYLYLDESGDLGFDFEHKHPSKHFTINILFVPNVDTNRGIKIAIRRTLKKKLNRKNKKNRIIQELKGTRTNLFIKEFFFNQIKNLDFSIFSMTMHKEAIYEILTVNKSRIYNFITRRILEHIPFEKFQESPVTLILDKSKGDEGINQFNHYISHHIEGEVHPKTPFYIYHEDSRKHPGLQAADLFAWGIHRHHEFNDSRWYEIFKEKIKYEEVFE